MFQNHNEIQALFNKLNHIRLLQLSFHHRSHNIDNLFHLHRFHSNSPFYKNLLLYISSLVLLCKRLCSHLCWSKFFQCLKPDSLHSFQQKELDQGYYHRTLLLRVLIHHHTNASRHQESKVFHRCNSNLARFFQINRTHLRL